MGEVNKEEIIQYLQEMMSLAQEYDRINDRIVEAWESGLASYKEILARGELPALLKKVRKVRGPKDSECYEMVKRHFEGQLASAIKEQAVELKFAEKPPLPGRLERLPLPNLWVGTPKRLLEFISDVLRNDECHV